MSVGTAIPPPSAEGLGRRTGGGEPALGALYVATTALVVLLVAIPIAAIVYGSLRTAGPGEGGDWTLQNYAGLASPGVLGSIGTTLLVGLATSGLCIVIGTAIALIVHRTDFRHKTAVTTLLALSFYFPSFILGMAWLIIGSPGGIINSLLRDVLGIEWLAVDIYTITGIIFVMMLHQVPFVYLTMRGPIIGMDGTFEEAARIGGATSAQVLTRVTLPLLAYSLLSSFILTFILTIEQFAIPALLGIPGQITVLATQLYLLCRFPPVDYGLAAAIGLTLSLITGLAILAQRRVNRAGRLTSITGKAGRAAPIRLGRWTIAANLFCFGFAFLALVLPICVLAYMSVIRFYSANPFEAAYTFRNYVFLWNSASISRSFWNTLIVSGVGAGIGVTIGLLGAYFSLRLKPRGYRVLDVASSIPFGVPGVVIGLGLLWAYAYLPLPLYGTLTLIIVAFVTRFLPYATETIGGQIVQIDKSLEEAAWVAGSSRLGALRRILIPIASPSIQGAYFLLFISFFREISSAVLLYTAATQVVSISIWGFFEQSSWGLASALSIIATIFVFIAMTVVTWLFPSFARK
jgi:iron(III) transport system permease protein